MDVANSYIARSKWLSGRGTKVLYCALLLGVVGGVGTGQALAVARDDAARAVQQQQVAANNARSLAEGVQNACKDHGFVEAHREICARAESISSNPLQPIPSGGSAGSSDVVETLGQFR